jgi:glycosyltransferase involved in cell wall biosynthesis
LPPIRVLHFIRNASNFEWFRLFVEHAGPERCSYWIGSLDGHGAIHEGMRELGVPTLAIDADGRRDLPRATLRLARWLRRNPVDVVHTHLLEASVVGLAAARLAGVPVRVFTAHHSHEMPFYAGHRSLQAAERLCTRVLAGHVIAPSREMRDTLVDFEGVPPARVEVIRHGVDLARFRPGAGDGAGFRARHDLDGRVVLAALSRYFWIKNLDALLRAFATVADAMPEAVLVVAGDGDPAPTRALACHLGVSERVRVLGTQPALDVLGAADLLVHPSLAESFGMVLVEAMAAAVPVLSTSAGIAGEVVEERRTGLRFRGTGEADLAEGLLRAWALRDDWPEMGRRAHERAQKYDPRTYVQAHERCYEVWAGEPAARRSRRSG